jgi:hypothetical protein
MDLVGDAKRCRYQFTEQGRDAAPGQPAQRFAQQKAKGMSVVSEGRAGFPPQLRLGEEGAHVLPIA